MISLLFRGREILHPDLGIEMLEHFQEMIQDISNVLTPPKKEGKRVTMTLAPKK